MPFNSIKRNNVTVIDKGQNTECMIFAHGFGTDQTAWNDIIPSFSDHYKIVLYDNAGAGKSDPDAFSPNRYNTLQSYADDLSDICKALKIRDAIFVGHSVSGMIGLLTAIKEPHLFSKLIFIGASPRYLNDANYTGGFNQSDLDGLYGAMENSYFAWVSGFSAAAMANPDRPHLASIFAGTLAAIRPDIALSVARVIFQSDHRSQLSKLDHDTLLIQTKEDIAVPMFAAEYLNKNIKNSRLTIVEAEGHFPHISAPEEIINAIQNFIRPLPNGTH